MGVAWSALGGTFESSRPDNPDPELLTLEMDLAARARFHLGGEQLKTFVVAQAGGQIVRTSIPVDPDASRHHIGPSAGGGLEFIVGDEYLIMLGARYALVPFEPSGVTLFLSVGFGGP
jgi:hypothetical protein